MKKPNEVSGPASRRFRPHEMIFKSRKRTRYLFWTLVLVPSCILLYLVFHKPFVIWQCEREASGLHLNGTFVHKEAHDNGNVTTNTGFGEMMISSYASMLMYRDACLNYEKNIRDADKLLRSKGWERGQNFSSEGNFRYTIGSSCPHDRVIWISYYDPKNRKPGANLFAFSKGAQISPQTVYYTPGGVLEKVRINSGISDYEFIYGVSFVVNY
jgi:hypothetical protein